MTVIVKDKKGNFLIGEGGKHKDVFRLKYPFIMKKTDEGIAIMPYDVEMIDTIIPFIDYYPDEYEYQAQPLRGFEEFYLEGVEKYLNELEEREEQEKQKAKEKNDSTVIQS